MRITRFTINEKGKVILTAVTDGENNFRIGDNFKLTTNTLTHFFKVICIEAVDKNELICTMKEIDNNKNRMYQYLIDPRYFIGCHLFKTGDIEN